jgi:uncharacterized membrane protein
MDDQLKDTVPLKDPQAFERRLRSRRHVYNSFEAKANRDRTLSERIADQLTSSLGSMLFLILNALWFGIWITLNTGLIPTIRPFDPFPFGLLTMIVSLEAIFLAIIVLISQNRAAKIDDLREEIGLQITTIAEEEITKIMELQVLLLKKQGLDISKDEELQQMLEPVDPNQIERSLKNQIKKE